MFSEFWHPIMSSPTEDTFEKRVEELPRRHFADHLEEVVYITYYRLDPWKDRLVKAWVNQHTHLLATWLRRMSRSSMLC